MDEGFYHSMTVDTMHQTSDYAFRLFQKWMIVSLFLALSAIPFYSPVISKIADVPRADKKVDFVGSRVMGHRV